MKKIASFIICLTLLMGTTAIADTQVYFEDFTGGLGAWTGPWALDNVIYYSSPQCMTDSPADSYPNNANQYQILNQDIDLVGYIGARVEFYTRWNIETGFDYCYFYISDDGGTNWDLLHTFNGESVADSTWQLHVNDIGGYAGDTVRFRFRLYSDGAYRADGIHIDDFEVIGEDTDISPPLILTDGTTDSTFAPDDYVTSATITDFSGVASASLTYTVDGATTVAPDSVVGDEYWFTIPQQAGGANMEYFISATDNAVPPNSGNTETYFYVAGYGLFYDDGDPEFIYQYAAGDQSATRFSVLGANQLVTGIFRLYTDVNRPLDTVYVEVWADNAGVPGTSIAGPWAVYPQSTLLDPQGWTY
ncbi:MAG: hypothetical protein GY855_04060, partial [candidate division Zixibacteria bacterium]|nr:hypothetical protein [candidate division Zixibacteria bacterium]